MTKTPLLPIGDRLKQAIQTLGLTRIQEIHEEALQTSTREAVSAAEVLLRLLEEECRARFERQVLRRIKDARIPVHKTLDTFDFKHPKRLKREQVLALFDLDFVPQKRNVVFLGRTGLGKTHLATALALAACQKGHRVLFSTAVNVVNQLQAAQADGSLLRRIKSYLSPDLLVLDELGYLPIDRKGADLLFQVISGRYERGSVLLTTNRPFKEWASIFNDATVAAAVIDRLAHHSEVVVIEGRSFRIAKDHDDLQD